MKSHIGNMFLRFDAHRNEVDAQAMKAYMKGQFEFCGIKAGPRRMLSKAHNRNLVLEAADFLPFVKICLAYPEREMHHYALDTIASFRKKYDRSTLAVSELFCAQKEWWDTVDTANSMIQHFIFKKDKTLLHEYAHNWMQDANFWIRRSAIISQLKMKKETDTALLEEVILCNLGSKEFFINKAIGWALREYGAFNQAWVIDFANRTDLAPLSRREALRKIM